MTEITSISDSLIADYLLTTRKTVQSLMRPAIEFSPEDSIGRFLQVMRRVTASELPVQLHGRLVGTISQSIIFDILKDGSSWETCSAINLPISHFMEPPVAFASADTTLERIVEIGRESNLIQIPVVDSENYLLGIINLTDILTPDYIPCYPSNVGGMATPFGVYLTNGNVRGGVNDFAIIASGAATGVLLLVAGAIVKGAARLISPIVNLPEISLADFDSAPSPGHPTLGIISILMKLTVFLVFILLIRFSRIAGYHAAEHQTVHAMERGEPLIPEVVDRMPRPHPRCGTNIMAASMLFFTLLQAFQYIPGLSDIGILPAGLFAWYNWKRFGTFLQARFTTRPASARELASGIRAAEQLQAIYINTPPARTPALRRLWMMGIIQTAIGLMLVTGLATFAENTWLKLAH